MAGAEIRLDPVPGSVPMARRWLRQALEFDEHCNVDIACLLMSELATNALLHSRTPMTLRLFEDSGRLRVEVSDSGRADWRPPRRERDDDAESGRGLNIVSLLASDWGVERNEDEGTTVWFELVNDESFAEASRDEDTG